MTPHERLKDACCAACLYWNGGERSQLSDCRRHAPRFAPAISPEHADTTLAYIAAWPTTLPDEWCGEFVREADLFGAPALRPRRKP